MSQGSSRQKNDIDDHSFWFLNCYLMSGLFLCKTARIEETLPGNLTKPFAMQESICRGVNNIWSGSWKVVRSLTQVSSLFFQVLINVKVAGVNSVDIYIRSGTHAIKPTLPYIPGKGGAGIVQQLGESVTKVKVTGLLIR